MKQNWWNLVFLPNATHHVVLPMINKVQMIIGVKVFSFQTLQQKQWEVHVCKRGFSEFPKTY